MKITLPKIYSQIGNQTPIGNSTINDIGCLTVDASMAATYFGHPIDPTTLAKSVTYAFNLPNNQGFRTLWIWSELTKLFPDIIYKGQVQTPFELTTNQMNQIKGIIDKGYPVFLQIDVIPSTSQLDEHWVLAIGYNGDDFIITNPLGGYIHNITDYGIKPQLLIWAYAWYEGKLPVTVDPLTECLRQHEELIRKLEEKNKSILEQKDTIKVMQNKIDGFQTEMTNKLAEKDRICLQKLQDYKTKVVNLTKTFNEQITGI